MKVFALIGILIVIASCTKFEDGPAISCRSAEKKIMGDWAYLKVFDTEKQEFVYSGIDGWSIQFGKESLMTKTIFYPDEQGIFRESVINGSWDILADNYIKIQEDGMDPEYFRIGRLSKKELWLKGRFEYIYLEK